MVPKGYETNANIEGVELTLYRDATGKLSLVNAFEPKASGSRSLTGLVKNRQRR